MLEIFELILTTPFNLVLAKRGSKIFSAIYLKLPFYAFFPFYRFCVDKFQSIVFELNFSKATDKKLALNDELSSGDASEWYNM